MSSLIKYITVKKALQLILSAVTITAAMSSSGENMSSERSGISFWEAKRGAKMMVSIFATIGIEILTAGFAPGWGLWATYIVLSERARGMPVTKTVQ